MAFLTLVLIGSSIAVLNHMALRNNIPMEFDDMETNLDFMFELPDHTTL